MTTITQVMTFYAALIIIFALIGFFIGKKSGTEVKLATTGAAIGAIVSVALWFTVGKKAVENPTAKY